MLRSACRDAGRDGELWIAMYERGGAGLIGGEVECGCRRGLKPGGPAARLGLDKKIRTEDEFT